MNKQIADELSIGGVTVKMHVATTLRAAATATGFLLSPDEFELTLRARLAVDRDAAWLLRDLTGREFGEGATFPLSVSQAETITALVGALFPAGHQRSGVMHGNRNPWDATDFVGRVINSLSALPHAAATEALERLIANPALGSYRDTLAHALARQRTRRRDAEYHRPNWDEAVAGFANGPPANVADLCALAVAQLEDIAVHIRSANTDIYKQFWNLDSWSRPTTTRPEEACRDALLTLLRPSMIAREITAEPEGHMVDDKRADIAVARPGMKVVVELKKDSHSDIWSAAHEQLDRFYTRDPEAKGFGIYGIFWFGENREKRLPAPPDGVVEPKTAAEMARALCGLLPEKARSRIVVIVFDVAAPGTASPISRSTVSTPTIKNRRAGQ
jgi:hypothetical protein